ncbi:LON peptidase N-terminal domain and RING finger protein 1-like [Hyperolius riggenbachi]|uniref:LON peptidase N-terminal domain and RING finger protein 1-like n=1 Tax=Hyperolius riggenbachi TaxID=752182 RepID=UPI0035A35E92
MELFSCPYCQEALWEPVTVPCGHTFCRRCLQGPAGSKCQVCQRGLELRGPQDLRCNTLVSNLLERCLDPETKVSRMTRDLQELVAQQCYEEAGKLASRAIGMAPQDVPLRVLRSQAYSHMKLFPDALRDAEEICRLQPRNPVGFYRKGLVLVQLEKKKEALTEFRHCLALNPQFSQAQQEIEQLMKDCGHPVPSALAGLLDEVSCCLKPSTADAAVLRSPLQTRVAVQGGENEETPAAVPPSGGTRKSMPSHQEQRKRKELDGAASQDRHRLNTDKEDEEICPSSAFKHLLSLSDVECSLCIRMFLEPVTTPCGHTFCKECLLRSLDHRPYCPLCKQSLQEYLRVGCYSITELLVELMTAVFPSEMSDRKQVHLSEIAELSNLVSNVPIFVCTVAFPGVACPLHVFEPRYRLMMRRCLDTGTKSFGMCLYESGKSFADYGCMLEILDLSYLPDGRSLVETVGRRRFRVLQRGQLDGYHKAEIEYLVDKRLEGEELQEVQRLHDMVYQQLEDCFSQPRGSLPQRVFRNHSSPPPKEDNIQASPDGPFWCWWLLSILPLDPVYQTLILSMTSLKERLYHLKHILSVFLQTPS